MNKKDYILLEYLCEKYGPDIIEEGLFKKVGPALAVGALTLAGGIGIHNTLNHRTAEEPQAIEQSVSLADQIPNYHELVQAVKEYMNWAVNCIGHDYSEIEIKPETLVELSYEYEYDLPMLLAALHLESHFGITPRAKRTGSPCSVGCWDNGKDKVYYDDQNEAVEDYIRIMQNDFIRNRKFSVAFADGNLVNRMGKRYASDKNYEKNLRSMRLRAIKKFPVLNNQTYFL